MDRADDLVDWSKSAAFTRDRTNERMLTEEESRIIRQEASGRWQPCARSAATPVSSFPSTKKKSIPSAPAPLSPPTRTLTGGHRAFDENQRILAQAEGLELP